MGVPESPFPSGHQAVPGTRYIHQIAIPPENGGLQLRPSAVVAVRWRLCGWCVSVQGDRQERLCNREHQRVGPVEKQQLLCWYMPVSVPWWARAGVSVGVPVWVKLPPTHSFWEPYSSVLCANDLDFNKVMRLSLTQQKGGKHVSDVLCSTRNKKYGKIFSLVSFSSFFQFSILSVTHCCVLRPQVWSACFWINCVSTSSDFYLVSFAPIDNLYLTRYFFYSPEVYTKDGNSYGKPCEFPFLYNMTWHHDCIQDGTHTGRKWCATSEDYTRDGKWGICLQPGMLAF